MIHNKNKKVNIFVSNVEHELFTSILNTAGVGSAYKWRVLLTKSYLVIKIRHALLLSPISVRQ